MGFDLLMAFALMNGIESFTRGKVQGTKEGTPGILVTRCIHFHLLADGGIGWPNVRAPMQIGAIQEDQLSWLGRLGLVSLSGIVTG